MDSFRRGREGCDRRESAAYSRGCLMHVLWRVHMYCGLAALRHMGAGSVRARRQRWRLERKGAHARSCVTATAPGSDGRFGRCLHAVWPSRRAPMGNEHCFRMSTGIAADTPGRCEYVPAVTNDGESRGGCLALLLARLLHTPPSPLLRHAVNASFPAP